MPDTLLRVLVVALGLLTYPRDQPGVEEWDEVTTVGMQKHEERLLVGGEKLDHKMSPVREEIPHTDKRGPQDDVKNIESDQRVTEKDTMSVLQGVSVIHQDSEEEVADHNSSERGQVKENSDPSWPQNSKSEPETALKTSQIDSEQNGAPEGQHEKPKEKEVFSPKEQESPPSHCHVITPENETSEDITDWEWDFLCYTWNILSIISLICFFRKYRRKQSQMKEEETKAFPGTCTTAEALLPDNDTLQKFHSKCLEVSSDKKWKEFLEGFTKDLFAAMRTACDSNGGMVIEDFQIVDVCDIIVPFTPPHPYSFQCQLWNSEPNDLLPDMQACGQIKLVEDEKIQNGCHCQSPNSDDMVCLLHCEAESVKTTTTDIRDVLLCMKNSPFLSKSLVTRWFQSTIKQAWEQISHKYEFELNISYINAPGALIVRFRSGKKISFSMRPVVKVNTDAHFFITHCSPNNSDTSWTLSLTCYEDRLLEHISKRLPVNSCHRQTLEIALFLHKRQTALLGSSALKDVHFKAALMHLLLTKDPSQWKPNLVACRLRDLLAFMERSLNKKLLQHVLIGNPLRQRVIELPAEYTHAKTVNLFHPLVVHNCIYKNAVMHFQEMLRNAHMLIHDYLD
ncbi:inositol 1,4,5-trisphosphate receptor-interacting protein [Anarrhichthys ocellatus]|uniref:inositol 1,4,5-trisphosphate receptor-interacting protein n=1 Tax=Anarrhichthys ocellatus TaxID=433405 RepID=UPI0012ED02C9|nr:inositol 1,4,5-trisphosphate receptor-interacting protein-like [Anarrhichthys ocellatus]XP_031720543.1 inositol 1,4,5-trisphosphate receptor-interacting protein-like [Anarrhichthys ocellatus]